MSMALLAVALVLLASHAWPSLCQWRQIDRLLPALDRLASQLGADRRDRLPGVLLRILLPSALLLGLQCLLADWFWGLPGLLLGVLVLYLCWGPRDLDLDVQRARESQDEGERQAALAGLAIDPAAGAAAAVQRLGRAGLVRWFGPLFWFALLGPAGALLFRLTQLQQPEPAPTHSALGRLDRLLAWPVAQLMALGLALVGDFDAISAAWQRWHAARAQAEWWRDQGFLDASIQAAVVLEQRETEEAGELEAIDSLRPDPLLIALGAAHRLLRRVLIAWLVVFALAVLIGVAG